MTVILSAPASSDASAYGERNADAVGNTFHEAYERIASLARCADVKVDEFVGPFCGISRAEFHRFAYIGKPFEIYPFDRAALLYVETRNDSFCRHG